MITLPNKFWENSEFTPVLDSIRRRRTSSETLLGFPIVLDDRVPDPDSIYELVGTEVRLEGRVVQITDKLRPLVRLEEG